MSAPTAVRATTSASNSVMPSPRCSQPLLQRRPKAVDLQEHLDAQLRHAEDQVQPPAVPVGVSFEAWSVQPPDRPTDGLASGEGRVADRLEHRRVSVIPQEDRLLAPEVAIGRPGRDLGSGGDRLHGRRLIALGLRESQGGVLDLSHRSMAFARYESLVFIIRPSSPTVAKLAQRVNRQRLPDPSRGRTPSYPRNGAGSPDSAYAFRAPTIRPHV